MASLNQHKLSLDHVVYCEARGAKTKEFLLAAKTGDCKQLEYLINDGCNINAVKSNGSNALMLASKNGHLQTIQLLITSGIDVNVKNNNGWDALMIASKNGRNESVEHLIQCGSDVNSVKNDGCNALMLAAERGLERTADILIQNKTELHALNIEGWNALMFASNKGLTKTVELLINNGADVNTLNKSGNNALMLASESGHREVVELLILSGAAATAINHNGSNALMLASKNGHEDTVEVLVQCGIDVNVVKNNGWNALMLASNYGHAATVELLIQCGGDVKAVDADGCSSLMLAAKSGHEATVQMLVKSGADVTAVNNQGYTAEMLASILRHENIIEFLKAYARPSSTDSSVEATNVRRTNPVGRMVHAANLQQNIPNAICEVDIPQFSTHDRYTDLAFNTNGGNSIGAEETDIKQTLASDRSLTPAVAANLAPRPGHRRPMCRCCGTCHLPRSCPAYGQTCENCGKMNHLASVCRVTMATAGASTEYRENYGCTTGLQGACYATPRSSQKRNNAIKEDKLFCTNYRSEFDLTFNTNEDNSIGAEETDIKQTLASDRSLTPAVAGNLAPRPGHRRPMCRCCGTCHLPRSCPAYGQTCENCGKRNHLASVCRVTMATAGASTERREGQGTVQRSGSASAIARGNTTEQPLLRSQSETSIRSTVCYCCGTSHSRGQCPAFGQTCSKCGKVNHLTTACKSPAKSPATQSKTPDSSNTSSASPDQDKPIHGKLQDQHYSLLQSKYTFLVENIDSKSIVNHLFSKNILDFNNKQLVTGKATPGERTQALLDIILYSGPRRAFPEFINALTEEYPHIAEVLSELV